MNQSMKIFLKTLGVGCCLSGAVIIAAIISDKPKYNAAAHKNAKRIYDISFADYVTSYQAANEQAVSAVYADREVWPMLSERTIVFNKIQHCNDNRMRMELGSRYEAICDEIDRRISTQMAQNPDLIAATDALWAKDKLVKQYECDSVVREQWRNQPLQVRVKTSLRKIFTNEKVY